MKTLERRKKVPVSHLGWYDEGGKQVKVWGFKPAGPNLAHSVELLDIALALRVDDVLIGKRIPKDWRGYKPDMVLLVGDKVFFLELDRDSELLDQIEGRMKTLADCPYPVVWVCPTDGRIDELMSVTTSEQHWFTTMPALLADPHGMIWENAAGDHAAIPHTSDVQLDVQSASTVRPMGGLD